MEGNAVDSRMIFSELVCQPALHVLDSSGVEPLLHQHIAACVPSGTVVWRLDATRVEPSLQDISTVLLKKDESLRYPHGIDVFASKSATHVSKALEVRRSIAFCQRDLAALKRANAIASARDDVREAFNAMFPSDLSEEDALFEEELESLRTLMALQLKRVYAESLESGVMSHRAIRPYVEAHQDRLLGRVAKLIVDRKSIRCDARKLGHGIVIPQVEFGVLKGCTEEVTAPKPPVEPVVLSPDEEPLLPTPPPPASWCWAPSVSYGLLAEACAVEFPALCCRLAQVIAAHFNVEPDVLLEEDQCDALVPVKMGRTWWSRTRAKAKLARTKLASAKAHVSFFTAAAASSAENPGHGPATAAVSMTPMKFLPTGAGASAGTEQSGDPAQDLDGLRDEIQRLDELTATLMLQFWVSEEGQLCEQLLRSAAEYTDEPPASTAALAAIAIAAVEGRLQVLAVERRNHDAGIGTVGARDCLVRSPNSTGGGTPTEKEAEQLLGRFGGAQNTLLDWLAKEALLRPVTPPSERAVVLIDNIGAAPHLYAALTACRSAVVRYATVTLKIARTVALLVAGFNVDALWGGAALVAAAGLVQPRVMTHLREIGGHKAVIADPSPAMLSNPNAPLLRWAFKYPVLRNAFKEVAMISAPTPPAADHDGSSVAVDSVAAGESIATQAVLAFADAILSRHGELKDIATLRPVREAVRVALFGPEASNLSKLLGRHGTIVDRCKLVNPNVASPLSPPLSAQARKALLAGSSDEIRISVDGTDGFVTYVPSIGFDRFDLSAITSIALCQAYLGHPHPALSIDTDEQVAALFVQKVILVLRHASTVREALVGLGMSLDDGIEQAVLTPAAVDEGAEGGTDESPRQVFLPFNCGSIAVLDVPGVIGRGEMGVDAVATWARSHLFRSSRGDRHGVAILKARLVADASTDMVVAVVTNAFTVTIVCRDALVVAVPSVGPLTFALSEKVRLAGATTPVPRHRSFTGVICARAATSALDTADSRYALWKRHPKALCECNTEEATPAGDCETGQCAVHAPQFIRARGARGPLYPFDVPQGALRGQTEFSATTVHGTHFEPLEPLTD